MQHVSKVQYVIAIESFPRPAEQYLITNNNTHYLMLYDHYFKLQYPYVYTVEKSISMKKSLEDLGYVNLKLRYDIPLLPK